MTDPTPAAPPSTTSTILVKAQRSTKFIDMTGQTFGMLTVVSRAKNRKSGGSRWHCICDCGNKTISAGVSLRRGQRDCGCLTMKMLRDRAIDGMIGKKFGKLTVIKFDRKASDSYELIFLCACDCGESVSVSNAALRRGTRAHCGCSATHPARFDNIPDRYKVSREDLLIGRQMIAYKSHAKKSHRAFELSFGLFKSLILGNCHYCGASPAREARNKSGAPSELLVNGIDRIDSGIGYVDGNIVSSCAMCNIMKLDHSRGDFLGHAQKITAFQNLTPEPIYLGC
jgi:hypothetical protein